jgi:nicotinate-nucleotide adenylyltransferase
VQAPADFWREARSPAGKRIGVLGGSFNPAHEGHRYISIAALKRLALDEVWWMVSPQNPLKDPCGMAPFEERVGQARQMANHPRILVTDIERTLGTVYTAETLTALTRRFPRHRFVWMMGADNLIQICEWKQWRKVFETVPIAVFARPSYSIRAASAKPARVFARYRVREKLANVLAAMRPPAWVFLHVRPHPGSASSIRAQALGSEKIRDKRGSTAKGSEQ